eukprot:3367253-Rhodomonas_salina.2
MSALTSSRSWASNHPNVTWSLQLACGQPSQAQLIRAQPGSGNQNHPNPNPKVKNSDSVGPHCDTATGQLL